MVKKITLFFSTSIRKRMRTGVVLEENLGLAAAMAFPINLMISAMRRCPISDEKAQSIGGAAWKFFDGSHAESRQVSATFSRSQHVEAVISAPLPNTVDLELAFYARGQRRPFYSIECRFRQQSGAVLCWHNGNKEFAA